MYCLKEARRASVRLVTTGKYSVINQYSGYIPMSRQQSLSRFFSSSGNGAKSNNNEDQGNLNKKRLQDSLNETEIKPNTKKQKFEDENNKSSSGEISKEDSPLNNLDEASKLIKVAEEERKEHENQNFASKIYYSQLTDMFEEVEKESSRLSIIAIVSLFYQRILENAPVGSLVKILYLCINRLGPDYEPELELGLGETLLIRAISECYGRAGTKIKKDYQQVGDLGIVAQKSRSGQPTMFKPAKLDIDLVFANLTSIAKTTGKDSQSKKISIINKMLTACEPKSAETKFLVRSLEGKLRIGLSEKTVLTAVAQAFVNYESKGKKVTPEKLSQAEEIVREAYSQLPNYEELLKTAYEKGIFNLLDNIHVTPGIPLKPMLAKPTKSVSEILDRFQGEEFTCEYKYDGERAQVHLLNTGEVKIYSRNLEDMSQRYPDLISLMNEFLGRQDEPGASMVLDCEAVAWDRQLNKILPFQVLSTRKRKDVEEKDIKVHICLFAFDILYYNGESLIKRPFEDRRGVLFKNFNEVTGKFQFASYKNTSNFDELQNYLDQSVRDSCEGLMVKMLHGNDSLYEPSKRSRNWLKLKKDYLEGIGDSLDLVVIGAYTGRGKRTGTYGGFLLASYNDDTGEYETTCKIGTGFSEEDLSQLHSKLQPTEIQVPKSYYVYDSSNSNASPDVWFEPTTVFEVLTADLSLSPVYKAASQEYGKGISLRFPRFIRVRDDKGIEEATKSTEVSDLYERQVSSNE